MKLGNVLGMPEDVFRYVPDNRLILPTCRLGVEFEYEGVRSKLAAVKEGWTGYWTSKPDHSLHDNGMEYVFSEPLFGADVIDAVNNLCQHAMKNKFKVSMRTGLHVHVDVRDMTRVELTRLNVLYALFERMLYRVAGHNREENVFCMPWYRADQMQNHVVNVNSDSYDIRAASEAMEQEKYGGMNLDTLARFGTVEFRMALSTTDAEWTIRWINLCLSFKRAAQKLDVQPLQLIHNMSIVGVEQFAKTVFEELYETVNYPEMAADVWNFGVDTALNVLPRAQGVIDKASLSWNVALAPPDNAQVNRRFRAFVDKEKPKVVPDDPFQLLRAPRVAFDFERQDPPRANIAVMDDDDGDENA